MGRLPTRYGTRIYCKDLSRGPFDDFIQGWLSSVQPLMSAQEDEFDRFNAFSGTDFSEEPKLFDVPVLNSHGTDGRIVPIQGSALLSEKSITSAQLEIYIEGSSSLDDTDRDELDADPLAFMQS